MLKVTLFGTPQVILDQRNLTATLAGRPLALLAYLAVTGQAHDRNLLTDLLWAEIGEAEARRNLRNTLYLLRQAVGDHLHTDRQTVALATGQPLWVDVTIFAGQFTTHQQHHPPELLQEAFDLYQGDFLAGLHINDAPAFESWVATRRHQLQEQAFHGWHRLANHYLETHAYSAGLAVTQRMLLLQPWREEAHRQQMLLLAANGQRSAALAQYEQCRHLLAAELAVEPMLATIALYEQIKRGESPCPPAQQGPYTNGHAANGNTVSRLLTLTPSPQTAPAFQSDVGAMPITPHFQGRHEELALLHQWLVTEKRRCVALLGMGGQGKSALAARFVTTLLGETGGANPNGSPSRFDVIIWRSLLNAPPFAELLADWLHQLDAPQPVKPPATLDQQVAHLFAHLRHRRCLLVLDNWESVLPVAQAGDATEQQGYGHFLRALVQTDHRSSVLLTSREQPRALTSSDVTTGAVRTLALAGLDAATGVQLLTTLGLHAPSATLTPLVHHFSGNPLALQLVIDTIEHLFGSNVAAFLAQESHFFGDIGALLDQQFTQLTPMQRTLLHWLALQREPVTAQTLWATLVQPVSQRTFWEALRALQRRSLVETHHERFGLQNVILEYTTERLLEQMVDAVIDLAVPGGQLLRRDAADLQRLIEQSPLNQYALLQAQTQEYIRQMQRRLVLTPVAQRLTDRWGVRGLAARLQALLSVLRTDGQNALAAGYDDPEAAGYIAANLLTLLLHCRVDLRGADFSYLSLRQPYLCDVTLPAVNFSHSHFRDALFTDPFEVVGALTFSPDGQWLITGSYDGLIRFWRTHDGQLHQILDGDQREIGSVVVAPNGEWLASACGNNQVRLWHLPGAAPQLTLAAPFNFPQPLAFSPDSQWLALTGEDGGVQIVTVPGGALVGTVGGMTNLPHVLAFSPDGRLLVAGCSDGLLYGWRLDRALADPTHQPTFTWRGHDGRLLALGFTADGQQLVTGGADGLLRCWAMRATTGATLQWQVAAHRDAVAALALDGDGQWVASGSPDGTIRLWSLATGALLATVETTEQRVRVLACSADGRTLASSGSSQRIDLWTVHGGQKHSASDPVSGEAMPAPLPTGHLVQMTLRQSIYGYANQLRALAFLPQGSRLVGGGTDKTIHLWDLPSGQLIQRWRGHPGWIQAIAVSPDGDWIASADQAHQIFLWDGQGATGEYQLLQRNAVASHLLIDLAFSADSQWLAAASGSAITLWRVAARPALQTSAITATFDLVQTLQIEASTIAAIAFHPTGNLLAATTARGDLYLWQTADGGLRQAIPHAAPAYMTLAFSADGQSLITAQIDGTLQVWPVEPADPLPVRCQEARILCQQAGRTVALALSPQGDTLATGAYDGAVYLWDRQRGALRYRLNGHTGWITRVSYSPDGQFLASAATDGVVQLWRVTDGACVHSFTVAGPYAEMNITHCRGLTPTQRRALKALGAIE